MKKVILLILIVFILSSCYENEVSTDYQQLSSQFNQFVIRDIHQETSFHRMTNELTTEWAQTNIRVHVKIFNQLGFLVEQRHATAFIVDQNDTHYIAVTTQDLFLIQSNQFISIDLYDYLGNVYQTNVIEQNDDCPIALLRFQKGSIALKPVILSSQYPMVMEPIFLLGNPYQTQNLILSGFFLGITDSRIETSIPSDTFGNGSAIYNIELKVIGMQISISDTGSMVLPSSLLMEWIHQINQDEVKP
jgi:hypothetical protein